MKAKTCTYRRTPLKTIKVISLFVFPLFGNYVCVCVCVCAIWMCWGGVWWVCWHYHGHDAGVYPKPNPSIFKHTMRTHISFEGRSTNIIQYNHSCPTAILLLFWREMRLCSWWTCWMARHGLIMHVDHVARDAHTDANRLSCQLLQT